MRKREIKDKLQNRCERIIKLINLGAPNIILENEVRQLNLHFNNLLEESRK